MHYLDNLVKVSSARGAFRYSEPAVPDRAQELVAEVVHIHRQVLMSRPEPGWLFRQAAAERRVVTVAADKDPPLVAAERPAVDGRMLARQEPLLAVHIEAEQRAADNFAGLHTDFEELAGWGQHIDFAPPADWDPHIGSAEPAGLDRHIDFEEHDLVVRADPLAFLDLVHHVPVHRDLDEPVEHSGHTQGLHAEHVPVANWDGFDAGHHAPWGRVHHSNGPDHLIST